MQKLAIFDFDWTLVKPCDGRKFPKNVNDWQWWNSEVLSVVNSFIHNDYTIVIATNQSKPWKIDMIRNVMSLFDKEPLLVCCQSHDTYKPDTRTFFSIITFDFDREHSLMVGDALGRPQDWNNTDKLFAINLNIPYQSPEQTFMKPFQLTTCPFQTPNHKETIILVGYPGSGKSTIANTFPDNYLIISTPNTNQMIQIAKPHINTRSIIFDSTNHTIALRSKIIQFSQKHNTPCHCIWLQTNIDTSIERMLHRAHFTYNNTPIINTYNNTPINFTINSVYNYRKSFEPPTLNEGFQSIKTI